MKKAVKSLLLGIALGLSIFALTGVVFDIAYSGVYHLENWSYTKMVLGSMAVGVGFSLPALVYGGRLPFPLKLLIHMGTGCTVMLLTALAVGWIPLGAGRRALFLAVACEVLTAFLIWLCFFLYHRRLARRLNEKLRERGT